MEAYHDVFCGRSEELVARPKSQKNPERYEKITSMAFMGIDTILYIDFRTRQKKFHHNHYHNITRIYTSLNNMRRTRFFHRPWKLPPQEMVGKQAYSRL
jgi:hypothetical protein